MVRGILVAGLLGGAVESRADVLRLKSGAELRGKVVKVDAARTADAVAIELMTGAVVTVLREDVAMQVPRPMAVEEYELRARNVAATLDAHWDLAEWCRQKHLTSQREAHLSKVLEFDPDHERARAALGHVWKEGAWVDYDDYMLARGYVKHRGRYITQQELDLVEKSADELKREQDWMPKVRQWTNWLTGNHVGRSQQGLASLKELREADAVPAVLKFLGEHTSPDVRQLGVQVLARTRGEKAAVALARMVLREGESTIRTAAIEGIDEPCYEKVQALFLRDLRNQNNAVVCRAALGLKRVGDERSIAPLIDALATSHSYQVRVRGAGGQTYSNGPVGLQSGSLPPEVEAGLRTGQYPNGVVLLNSPNPADNMLSRVVTVRVDHQNAEVRAALHRLTGQDFGYDERLWHLWWASRKQSGSSLPNS